MPPTVQTTPDLLLVILVAVVSSAFTMAVLSLTWWLTRDRDRKHLIA